MDASELRTRFRSFAGEDRYRKFVRVMNRVSRSKGRLLHWQEQLWDAFTGDTPHADQLDVFTILSICDIHDRRLETSTVLSAYGEIRDTPEYDKAYETVFPFAVDCDLICSDCHAAREHWIAENQELCRILRCQTTYQDYCERRLADLPDRESLLPRIESRAAEISDQMEPDDDLWEWDAGGWHRLSGSAGVAIVRNGQILKRWCEWRSQEEPRVARELPIRSVLMAKRLAAAPLPLPLNPLCCPVAGFHVSPMTGPLPPHRLSSMVRTSG